MEKVDVVDLDHGWAGYRYDVLANNDDDAGALASGQDAGVVAWSMTTGFQLPLHVRSTIRYGTGLEHILLLLSAPVDDEHSLFTFVVWRNDDFMVSAQEVIRLDLAIGAEDKRMLEMVPGLLPLDQTTLVNVQADRCSVEWRRRLVARLSGAGHADRRHRSGLVCWSDHLAGWRDDPSAGAVRRGDGQHRPSRTAARGGRPPRVVARRPSGVHPAGPHRDALAGVDLDIGAASSSASSARAGAASRPSCGSSAACNAPGAGAVQVGRRERGSGPTGRQYGLVPQSPALVPWKTVRENVRFLSGLHRQRSAERPLDDDEIAGLLDAVGLTGFEKSYRTSCRAGCSSASPSCAPSPSARRSC